MPSTALSLGFNLFRGWEGEFLYVGEENREEMLKIIVSKLEKDEMLYL